MILKSGILVANRLSKSLTIAHIFVKAIDVFAHKDNKDDIYIGGFETSAEEKSEKGYVLSPGDVFSLSSDDINDNLNLSIVFVAAKNPGDYVTWGALLLELESN